MGAARKRHHMGRKCQHTARSHAGVSAHAAPLHEEQGAPGGVGGPTAPPGLCWSPSLGCVQSYGYCSGQFLAAFLPLGLACGAWTIPVGGEGQVGRLAPQLGKE